MTEGEYGSTEDKYGWTEGEYGSTDDEYGSTEVKYGSTEIKYGLINGCFCEMAGWFWVKKGVGGKSSSLHQYIEKTAGYFGFPGLVSNPREAEDYNRKALLPNLSVYHSSAIF